MSETLDLNDLPWILKPITWIYKYIKKTTIVRINDNINTDICLSDHKPLFATFDITENLNNC